MHSEQRGGDEKNDAHGPRGHVVKSFGCGGAEIAELALLPISMAATLVALLAASWAPLQTGRPALLPVRTRSLRAATPRACGASDEDKLADAISTCRSMRVSELKAELSLRGVSADGCFEKEELVQKLARARAEGRADPSVIDAFNKESAEQAWRASDQAGSIADPDAADGAFTRDDVTAGDGSMPGGMSPEMLERLTSSPELMSMLRNPKMQDVMKAVMEGGPDAFEQFKDDTEVRELLRRVSELTSEE